MQPQSKRKRKFFERFTYQQVVQVLNFDIHLVKDFRGRRYIERVTECIPIENKNEYTFEHQNVATLENKMDKFFDNATHYFTKVTDRQLYKYVNILEYIDGEYVLTNKISDTNIKEMRNNMDASDVELFDDFIQENWGIRNNRVETERIQRNRIRKTRRFREETQE